MTNPTIAVPRELLERVAKPVETQYDRDQRWKALVELRALLTAQPQATTRADGANISEAPVGFKRPTVPPPAPPRRQASAAQSAPDELLPCPFCGGADIRPDANLAGDFLQCWNCGARGPLSTSECSSWQARAAQSAPAGEREDSGK